MESQGIRIKFKDTRTVCMETPILFGVLSMELMVMAIMFREEEIPSAEMILIIVIFMNFS